MRRSNTIRLSYNCPLPARITAFLSTIATVLLTLLGCVPAKAQQQTLYYVPHTHWEGAVFKTREEYLKIGLPHIATALDLLEKYPHYKFALDQVAYFKPFLDRYPERASEFKRFVREGRLEIVGGMDVMPDDVKPGGELFVRQMMYGKLYCRRELGVDVKAAWLIDTFGHHPQIPQLLRLAGFDSFWFCRGVPTDDMVSEFKWRGIDGTAIPAFWLPGFYGLFYGPPADSAGFAGFFRERFDALNSHARGSERVGLAGVDVSEPEKYTPPLVEEFNTRANAPFRIRYSTPSEFAAVVARRKDTPVMSGDFNPIFQGTYSSRVELKQRTREVEDRLLTAEKLGALAGWLGAPQSEAAVWNAWEPLLFNQTHDLASGVMTDHVYEDVVRGYDSASSQADALISRAWSAISRHIQSRGPGIPIVVFNGLGWPRTDAVEIELELAAGTGMPIVLDTDRHGVPCQVMAEQSCSKPGLRRYRMAILARNVPAMGYETLYVKASAGRSSHGATHMAVAPRTALENEFYRVTVDAGTGAISSIVDKQSRTEALAGLGNVVAQQTDHGDLWELYHGLDGGSHVAMTTQQAVPEPGKALFSTDERGASTLLAGPVYSEVTVRHPFAHGTFSTRIRLYHGVRRVDISSTLVNSDKYVRYQVMFPTSITRGANVQSIPFGSVGRPLGIEYPAQEWVDYGDARRGVTLANVGMPGNLVAGGIIILSMMRAHNLGAYGYGGGYEPGMTSDTGFELSVPRTLHYAVMPHSGDWRSVHAYRLGMELNHPMVARAVAPHSGSLPPRWGMLRVSSPSVVVTALRAGPNGTTVLRMYEADGQPARGVRVRFAAPITDARAANLLEDAGKPLHIDRGAVVCDLHPFEVKTVRLRLGAGISRAGKGN